MPTLLLFLALQTPTHVPTPVYDGRSGDTDVHLQREPDSLAVVVDGLLDEAPWSRAARLTGFSQYSPQDGVPAADSTEVRVWYSSTAIHFGVLAFAERGSVRATLADRDRIDSDDQVLLLLDTFDDARRALVFGMNPLGVQLDGTRVEGGANREAFAAEDELHPLDENPDFVYESAGRLTEAGYTLEVRIPFETLPYQSADVQSWGFNVVRLVQSRGHSLTWTAARQGESSFLAQGGRLAGLEGLSRGLVLDITPVVTARADGAEAPDGTWDYTRGGPELGGSLRLGITENLTLGATVNPDFSQVEADAGQLVFDPRSAVFFPEARPFFLEGSERFRVPNGLIYTRSIVRPEFAAKLSGKVGDLNVGGVLAVDDREASLTGERPLVGIVRLTRDVGERSSVGLVYTDRSEGGAYNRVGGLDGRLIWGANTLSLQGSLSGTRTESLTHTGHLWDAGFERAGRRFGFDARFRGTSRDFQAASGFLSRVGTVSLRGQPRFTFPGDVGDRVESYSFAVNMSGLWLHEAFFDGEGPEDLKLHFNNNWSLAGGWQLGASALIERFWYPDYLYPNLAVQAQDPTQAPQPFVGTPTIDNYDLVLTVNTPQWSTLGANVFFIVGRDVNFDEWAEVYVVILNTGLEWRPTDRLRVNPTYARQQYVRPDGRGTVRVRDIPRIKLEYQLTRAIFVRWVGQYDASRVDALRDDTRTNRPLLSVDPISGAATPILARSTSRIRNDILFSYQPTPGTVFFAGYGSSLSEDEPFRFREITRTRDGFFLKASYLFRR